MMYICSRPPRSLGISLGVALSMIHIFGPPYHKALRCMPWGLTEGKSTLMWQHQAITLAHADPDLCRHMASLGCNESMICCVMVTPQFLSYKIRSIIKRTLIYSWSLSNETYIHTSVCLHWASSARLFSIYHSRSLLMISKLINTRRSELFLKSVLKQMINI